MKKSTIDINELIKRYNETPSLHQLATEFHTSHLRLSSLLKENGIIINNIGCKKEFTQDTINTMINDYKVNHLTMENISKKYSIRIKRLRQLFKDNEVVISKWNGHIKKEKPLFIRKITCDCEYKQCPYCQWKTKDILNKSNAFQKHITTCHNIDLNTHLSKYPDDEFYLKGLIMRQDKIQCKICGKYLSIIDNRHLRLHNTNVNDYEIQYNKSQLVSNKTKEKLSNCYKLMMQNEEWERQTSKYEKMIQTFLEQNNIQYVMHDRTILDPLEIDFLLPQYHLGIEFNGNLWHTEQFGKKSRLYHLNKTLIANQKGYSLIQIFEDEMHNSPNIVFSKLSHILHIDKPTNKIMARKCTIKEININTAISFLNQNHIQGFTSSTLYLGCFYNDLLVGVMTFLQEKKDYWNLTRFASLNGYICQGIGGKMLSFFIKKYNPQEIKSFADRRWTIFNENNLYTKLGFELTETLKPDYRYYNPKVDKYTRFHKFKFRKKYLSKKYNLSLQMTEKEMTEQLGYDRIWDCGLFKYVWKKEGQ